MSIINILILSIIVLLVGFVGGFIWFRYIMKGQYNNSIKQAKKDAEVLKEKKLLQVKEKFINKRNELDREFQQRNIKIQQNENRLKQKELSLTHIQDDINKQKQEVDRNRFELEKHKQDIDRYRDEVDKQKQNIENNRQLLRIKEEELEKQQQLEREKLEELSGLSSEEAKERLIESLKDQAKLDAASYINEIVDEAKLNASQQAKKIIIQTIQRVATETAIENSVSVFHIDSDEVKGRIIGREGRNIRACLLYTSPSPRD